MSLTSIENTNDNLSLNQSQADSQPMDFHFNDQEEYFNWRRTKVHLHLPFRSSMDGYLDLDTERFFTVTSTLHCSSHTLDELPLCYGTVSNDTCILVGVGQIEDFMRYTPASNGYPEAPWDNCQFKKVYVYNLAEAKQFFLCTFRGINNTHPEFIEFDIKKVSLDADKSHYQLQLTYDEYQTQINTILESVKKSNDSIPTSSKPQADSLWSTVCRFLRRVFL